MHYDLPRGNKIEFDRIRPGDSINGWTFLETPTANSCRIAVRCRCGRERSRMSQNILAARSLACKSCAIGDRARTHGATCAPAGSVERRLYRVWDSIKWRCNPNNHTESGRKYAHRGVTVCAEWQADFPAFLAWATAAGYAPGLTIDRIDNAKGYEPGNCRWATTREQARNKTTNRRATAYGETKPLAAWYDDPRCRVPAKTVRSRICCGMDLESAMTRPVRRSVGGRYTLVPPPPAQFTLAL